nr:unnamed protein product [Callosobruchus analis]
MSFNGNKIESSLSAKFLGIHLDHHLSWEEQVNSVCSKLSKSFYLLKNLTSLLNEDGLINVYYGLVYSNISYCITVWGLAKDVERIFIFQKRIVRLICKIPYRNTCRDAFEHLLIQECFYSTKEYVEYFTGRRT